MASIPNDTAEIKWELLRADELEYRRHSERGEGRVWHVATLGSVFTKRNEDAVCELKKLVKWTRLTKKELVFAMLDSIHQSVQRTLEL
jgi:hypothetical protein